MAEKRGFTGYWISAQLAMDGVTSWPEKALLCEIDQLHAAGECRASIRLFCKHLGVSIRQVQNYLTRLEEFGLMTKIQVDEKRVLIPTGVKKVARGGEETFMPPHERSFTQKYKKRNTTEEDSSQPPAVREPTPLSDPLRRAIDESFRSVQVYENFAKERGQIGVIAKRCQRLNPEHPEEVAQKMLETFKRLRETDGWWGRQPFIPSALASMWERIESQAKGQQSTEDWMKSFLAQREDA